MWLRTPSELGGGNGKCWFLDPCPVTCIAPYVRKLCLSEHIFVRITERLHMCSKEGNYLCGLCEACCSGSLN